MEGFLIVLAVGVFVLLPANLLVQRFFPTTTADSYGRRIAFRLFVAVLTASVLLGGSAIYIIATGGNF